MRYIYVAAAPFNVGFPDHPGPWNIYDIATDAGEPARPCMTVHGARSQVQAAVDKLNLGTGEPRETFEEHWQRRAGALRVEVTDVGPSDDIPPDASKRVLRALLGHRWDKVIFLRKKVAALTGELEVARDAVRVLTEDLVRERRSKEYTEDALRCDLAQVRQQRDTHRSDAELTYKELQEANRLLEVARCDAMRWNCEYAGASEGLKQALRGVTQQQEAYEALRKAVANLVGAELN